MKSSLYTNVCICTYVACASAFPKPADSRNASTKKQHSFVYSRKPLANDNSISRRSGRRSQITILRWPVQLPSPTTARAAQVPHQQEIESCGHRHETDTCKKQDPLAGPHELTSRPCGKRQRICACHMVRLSHNEARARSSIENQWAGKVGHRWARWGWTLTMKRYRWELSPCEEETMEQKRRGELSNLPQTNRRGERASKSRTNEIHGGEMAVAVSSSTMEQMATKFQKSQLAVSTMGRSTTAGVAKCSNAAGFGAGGPPNGQLQGEWVHILGSG